MLRGAYARRDKAVGARANPPKLTPIVIAIWLPPLRLRSAAMPQPPLLPACGGYACEGLWSTEVRYVIEGKHRKKPPLAPCNCPWRSSATKIFAIFPCSGLLLLLRSLVIAGLDGYPVGPGSGIKISQRQKAMSRWGPASRYLIPGKADLGPMAPTPTKTSLASAPTVVH